MRMAIRRIGLIGEKMYIDEAAVKRYIVRSDEITMKVYSSNVSHILRYHYQCFQTLIVHHILELIKCSHASLFL